jgi:hypothetical protein
MVDLMPFADESSHENSRQTSNVTVTALLQFCYGILENVTRLTLKAVSLFPNVFEERIP